MLRRMILCGGTLLLAGAVLLEMPRSVWARGGGGGGHFGGASFGGDHGGHHRSVYGGLGYGGLTPYSFGATVSPYGYGYGYPHGYNDGYSYGYPYGYDYGYPYATAVYFPTLIR